MERIASFAAEVDSLSPIAEGFHVVSFATPQSWSDLPTPKDHDVSSKDESASMQEEPPEYKLNSFIFYLLFSVLGGATSQIGQNDRYQLGLQLTPPRTSDTAVRVRDRQRRRRRRFVWNIRAFRQEAAHGTRQYIRDVINSVLEIDVDVNIESLSI